MSNSYVNEALNFVLQAIRDEATKPLHVEIERLNAELARLKAKYERSEPSWDGGDND